VVTLVDEVPGRCGAGPAMGRCGWSITIRSRTRCCLSGARLVTICPLWTVLRRAGRLTEWLTGRP